VVNREQQLLGRVDHLLETGANDVLVVRPYAGSLDGRERLLPYTDDCVLQIDLDKGMISVEWDADF
jgi:16S rRNA processing protein RimM